jgi:hypothetical protein
VMLIHLTHQTAQPHSPLFTTFLKGSFEFALNFLLQIKPLCNGGKSYKTLVPELNRFMFRNSGRGPASSAIP